MKVFFPKTFSEYLGVSNQSNIDTPPCCGRWLNLRLESHQFFYGNEKAKSRRTDETKQYDTITYLEKKIDGTMSPILKGELEQKLIEAKENLEKMYEYKTQGTILRSKTRWYNEGEKNSKYFFNLEKRHFKRKVIISGNCISLML